MEWRRDSEERGLQELLEGTRGQNWARGGRGGDFGWGGVEGWGENADNCN